MPCIGSVESLIAAFSQQVIKDIAQNMLSFMKANCTQEGHTYWLFKGVYPAELRRRTVLYPFYGVECPTPPHSPPQPQPSLPLGLYGGAVTWIWSYSGPRTHEVLKFSSDLADMVSHYRFSQSFNERRSVIFIFFFQPFLLRFYILL